jgi:hypothetical protein
MARCVRTADAARGGRTRGGGALSGGTPGRARCRENVRCAKTLESTSAPASSETGTYRLHLGHRDPGSTLSIRAEPLQDTRAPRSARDARRARLCASPASRRTRFPVAAFRFFPQLPQPQPHHRNGPLGFKNALSRVSPLNETAPRSNAKLRASRGGAKLGETNEREICEGRQAGPARGTRGARGTHTTACLVRLHHRDVFGIARRKVRPATADATDRTADPCPSAALPAPVCQRGN